MERSTSEVGILTSLDKGDSEGLLIRLLENLSANTAKRRTVRKEV
jgi:hypothetical protein